MIKIDKVVDAISSFLKERFDSMKGDLIEKISSIISKIISFFILFLILMFVIGFAIISLGNYINTVLDSSFLGYGIISLFYLIIFFLLFELSKSGTLKKMLEKEMRKGLKS